jgi:O-antigen ligase
MGWPVDYLVMIPSLIYGYISIQNDPRKLPTMPQYKLLVSLLVIIFLSDAIQGYMDLATTEFILFFKRACIFIIIIFLVRSSKDMKRVLFLIVLFATFIAGQAIWQYFSGSGGIAGQGFYHNEDGVRTKWVGLWNGANMMALLLNMSVPFALEFASGSYSAGFRIFNALCVMCLIGGVYTTNSRGGFLTLLSILFLFPMFKLKSKKVALIVGAGFAGLVIVNLAPSRMNEVNSDEESAYVRTRLWNHGLEMFQTHPLLGVGKGRFVEEAGRGLLAHSNFIQNIGETGGLGIFCWIGLIYFSIKGLWTIQFSQTLPDPPSQLLKSLSRALMVSLVAFCVCTIFVTMEVDLYYLVLGLCAATINIMHQTHGPFKVNFTKRDVLNILVIIIFLLIFYRLNVRHH